MRFSNARCARTSSRFVAAGRDAPRLPRKSFLIEVGLAYGGDLRGGPVTLYRFANRVRSNTSRAPAHHEGVGHDVRPTLRSRRRAPDRPDGGMVPRSVCVALHIRSKEAIATPRFVKICASPSRSAGASGDLISKRRRDADEAKSVPTSTITSRGRARPPADPGFDRRARPRCGEPQGRARAPRSMYRGRHEGLRRKGGKPSGEEAITGRNAVLTSSRGT